MNILQIQPGDIVRNVKTTEEKVVVSFRADMGLIEFEDSHLYGWTNANGWIPTGKKVEKSA
jgi:hypothetical protein